MVRNSWRVKRKEEGKEEEGKKRKEETGKKSLGKRINNTFYYIKITQSVYKH